MSGDKRSRPGRGGGSGGLTGQGDHRQRTRRALNDAGPWLLAAALAPTSLLLHDTPRFSCPVCRAADATPDDEGWRCSACKTRGTRYGLRHLVARDRRATAELLRMADVGGGA